MTEFNLPEMGIEQTEEALLQALNLIDQLLNNYQAGSIVMAAAFLSDFQPKDLSYDGSFLTGSQDELLF